MTALLPKTLKVIHVDDDQGTIQHMKKLLEKNSKVDYLNGFTSADEALVFLEKEKVDIAFLDIEMPGHNGLWLAAHLQKQNIDLVFVSGHAAYASQAFEICALDYLLKPLDADKIHVLLQKFEFEKKRNQQLQYEQVKTLNDYFNGREKPKKIFINMAGSTILVHLDEIIYFNSKQNYTVVTINNGDRHTASKNIKTFEDALKDNREFLRISRSYIVNKNFIKSIQRNPRTRGIALMMTNGDLLETSYKTKEDIMDELI